MTGKYLKAPLVYMAAGIKTSNIPSLEKDRLEQLALNYGFPHHFSVTMQGYNIDVSNVDKPPTKVDAITRHGLFNRDKTTALIINHDGIEWRTTNYSKFHGVMEEFTTIFEALRDEFSFLANVSSTEIILNYADLIIPYPERQLKDYFKEGNRVLPNEVFPSSISDKQCLGAINVERVVNDTTRILTSLEQLPIIGDKLPRYIPQLFRENANEFAQPLTPKGPEQITSDDYALLATQAGQISGRYLKEFNIKNEFETLHKLTSDTFNSLINKDVCDIDWEYHKES